MDLDEINVIRSNRRTIAVQVSENGLITIRVPIGINEVRIYEFLEKHRNWITRKQNEIKKRVSFYKPKRFVESEKFLYLGKYYPFRFDYSDSGNRGLRFDNGFFLNRDLSECRLRELFENWYRKAARKVISERADFYSGQSGLRYSKLRITGAKKRWGSCSVKGYINFSWRLVMAPLNVIDYVVVHELVHLVEKNHSKRFWNTVGHLKPDYKKLREWLKRNGHMLRL